MKAFLNLFKKDLKELITFQLLIPLIIVVAFYGFIGNMVQSETSKTVKPEPLLIVDYDSSTLSNEFITDLKSVSIPEIFHNDGSNPIEYAQSKDIRVVIEIPQGFEKSISQFKQPELKIYSVIKGASATSISEPTKVKSVITLVSDTLSNMYIKGLTKVDPAIIKNPISIKEFVVINGKIAETSPEVVSGLLMSQIIFIPLILAIVIMFSSQMLVSLIAGEKENKTLETLMTAPIKRPLIIVSKMLASSIMALIISVFYLFGMRSYINGVSMGELTNSQNITLLKELGLAYTPTQYFYIGLLLFLSIVAALALSSILAIFAEDTKTAQTYLMPLTILVMIPYLLSIFVDINALSLPVKIVIYLIPFSYPFIASQQIMFGNMSIFYVGVAYLTIFSIVAVLITTKLISSDRIFTTRVRTHRRRGIKSFGRSG